MFGWVQAQETQVLIDNLKAELKTKPDAKKTASIYSDLTWYYSNVAIDSALYYGGKAVQESTKLGDSTLLSQVYSDVGAVYFRKGDFLKSKENYFKARIIRTLRKDYYGLAKTNANLGNVYLNQMEYKSSMKFLLAALQYFEKIKDENNANTTKGNIGYLFVELKNYPKAISYLQSAIQFAEKNKLSDRLCEFYLNIGNAYKESNDSIHAKEYYYKSLKNCQKIGNKKAAAIDFQNIGLLQAKNKKTKESEVLYAQSKKLNDEVHSNIDNANLNISIARNYIRENKIAEAKKLLLSGLQIFDDNFAKDDQLATYKLLVTVYAYLKQPDSVVFYNNLYTERNEKMIQTATLKLTSELETKYQTAKKEKLLLEKEAETQQKTSWMLALAALAFFIALIGFLIYRQQKLKNKQQVQEFQLKSAIAQIETQNQLQEQRLSISRDLHDNIGAQLTFIISSVDTIQYGFDLKNSKIDSKLQSISNFTKATIVELRDTIWAMNTSEITFEDLRARIHNFIENAKMAKENIQFQFSIDTHLDQTQLSSIVGMNLYRTLQEAVNNALKYSDATTIQIAVQKTENSIRIEIQDNGVGFDPETIVRGNGLLNMQQRIENLGGIFTLKSELGKGTSISILLNL